MSNHREDQEYVAGSEQFLAAVWYVMKRAEQRFHETKGGRQLGRWAFLNWVLNQLSLPSQNIGYHTMREELIEFAETFGTSNYRKHSRVSRAANEEARKEFQ